jgi:NADPH-dependent ferric siderophore reductase
MNLDTRPTRAPQRIRHELKARKPLVRRTQQISAHFMRITFAGEDLHDFVSASFDDHVKLMLPAAQGTPLVLPVRGPDGPILPAGATMPVMRDYTPRRHDAALGELDIEFALHGDGHAARWAARAQPGDQVGIGGPRGSLVIPTDYDWHLLIGDETALPAIARRLEELPAGARVIAVIQTGDLADRRDLQTAAQLQLQWITGDDTDSLAEAARGLRLPHGEGYAWAAGEAAAIALTRRVLVEQHGLDKGHVRAAAYWKRGASAHHENLEG